MLLIQIKQFIQAQHEVSLSQLSRQFDIPAEAMKEMVKKWIIKGLVREESSSDSTCQTKSGCGSGCGGCSVKEVKEVIRYHWQG